MREMQPEILYFSEERFAELIINKKKAPFAMKGALRFYLGTGLLSHVKVRSIMGDEELNFRVRNGIGCTLFSMDTKEIP